MRLSLLLNDSEVQLLQASPTQYGLPFLWQIFVDIVDWWEKKGGRVEKKVREADTKTRGQEKIYTLVTNWFLE